LQKAYFIMNEGQF